VELLEFAQLSDRADSVVETLSGGMKRRLSIARSLINNPQLLLLDEPTTGLDPQARHVLWDRLYRLKQQGVTQVLTTHYMDEAEQLCDRLVVMDQGLIVAEGSPRSLIEQYATREVLELRFPPAPTRAWPRRWPASASARNCCPTASWSTRTTARRLGRGARARPATRERARASVQPGGRVPAAHRTHAGRLMSTTADAVTHHRRTPGAFRVVSWHLATYRRFWR
jgi:ABC-type glutathione transport system ATPase component